MEKFYVKEGIMYCADCNEPLESNYPADGLSCFNCGQEIADEDYNEEYKWDCDEGIFKKEGGAK